MILREKMLLDHLKNGDYDGSVGNPTFDEQGNRITYCIENGVPCKYEENPVHSIFRRSDAPTKYHPRHKVEEYTTDDSKLKFLRDKGYDMDDRDVRIYSTCYDAAKAKLNNPHRSKFPPEEQLLLSLLKGVDEPVGKGFYDERGRIVSYWIIEGVPCKFESRPIHRTYHGKENPVTYTPPRVVKRYDTDSKKLLFIMEYGQYMSYEIFQEYSKKSGCALSLPKTPHELEEKAKAKAMETFKQPEVESRLLSRLKAGELDGPVGMPCDNGYGSTIWYWIEDGIIKRFKQGPTKKFFNGDETEKIIPDWKPDRQLKTEEEQLDFLRRCGRHMSDSEVIAYSDDYWDWHRGRKAKSYR